MTEVVGIEKIAEVLEKLRDRITTIGTPEERFSGPEKRVEIARRYLGRVLKEMRG